MARANDEGDGNQQAEGELETKRYRVQTPIKVHPEEIIKEGAIIELDANEAAELVAVAAIVEA